MLSDIFENEFMANDDLPIFAGRLVSEKSALKYDFSYLDICLPDNMMSLQSNIGEAISGDKLEETKITALMMKDVPCEVLCQKETFNNLEWFLRKDYSYRLYLDNLPSAYDDGDKVMYRFGIPLGFVH